MNCAPRTEAAWLTPGRVVLLLFAAVFLVYAHTLSYGLTLFDDYQLLYVNKAILSSASNIGKLFSTDVFMLGISPYYRPLLGLTFMTDTLANGPYLFVYHLTNILLHGAASALLYLTLQRFGRGRPLSLFLSLVFLCHPALTPAVAWVPGRNDSLLCIFVLLSFLSFLRYLESRARVSLLAFALSFLCALLTKETAVMLPLLLAFYCLYAAGGRPAGKTWLPLAGVSAAVLAVWGAARFSSETVNRGVDITATLLNSKAYVVMLGKTLFPVNLGVWGALREADYKFGAAAIALLAAVFAFLRPGRKGLAAFGLLWYVLFLCPSFTAIPGAAPLVVWEHRLYLPLVGFLLAVSELDGAACLDFSRLIVAGPAACLVLLFASLSFVHSYDYSSSVVFWERAVAEVPDEPGVTMVMARVYHLEQMLPLAEKYYRRSLELDPAVPYAHANLAGIYAARGGGKLEEKELVLELAVNPSNILAVRGLAAIRAGKSGRRIVRHGPLPERFPGSQAGDSHL